MYLIAAAVALVSTVLAVSRKNAVHALLFLILSLLSVAVVFYMTGAPFIAALEVIIYAGAIMVLFVFVVMMMNEASAGRKDALTIRPGMLVLPASLAAILLADFVVLLSKSASLRETAQSVVPPYAVGASLFTTYVLGVEIAAFLLLTGIVGAHHLGRQKHKSRHRFLLENNTEGESHTAHQGSIFNGTQEK